MIQAADPIKIDRPYTRYLHPTKNDDGETTYEVSYENVNPVVAQNEPNLDMLSRRFVIAEEIRPDGYYNSSVLPDEESYSAPTTNKIKILWQNYRLELENTYGTNLESNLLEHLANNFESSNEEKLKAYKDTVIYYENEKHKELTIAGFSFGYAILLESNASSEALNIYAEDITYLTDSELDKLEYELNFVGLVRNNATDKEIDIYSEYATKILSGGGLIEDFSRGYRELVSGGAGIKQIEEYSKLAYSLATHIRPVEELNTGYIPLVLSGASKEDLNTYGIFASHRLEGVNEDGTRTNHSMPEFNRGFNELVNRNVDHETLTLYCVEAQKMSSENLRDFNNGFVALVDSRSTYDDLNEFSTATREIINMGGKISSFTEEVERYGRSLSSSSSYLRGICNKHIKEAKYLTNYHSIA